ncbi:MAG: hypothetical protein R3F50_19850 [Gammaproteobacteria bacterium]
MKYEVKKSIRSMAKAGLLAGSLTGLAVLSQGTQAATGQVQVDVSFPPLVILYYYDQISVDVNAAQMAVATGLASTDSATVLQGGVDISATLGSISEGSISASASASTEAGASGATTTIAFDIDDVWAVRSLASNNLTATLTGTSGEFTSISSTLAGANVAPGWSLGAGNIGDITFEVDLTAVTNPLSVSDVITIEVTP